MAFLSDMLNISRQDGMLASISQSPIGLISKVSKVGGAMVPRGRRRDVARTNTPSFGGISKGSVA
ncbi:hypothetical protein [Paraburkholderia strydomiana]|uniref:hypothetical protein n=1 Tax=Paraburkholderia strydomiana TaxID=1245417 RepID=UPI001BE681E4|nr:hypothetical protein [Paraburkholderia strydomiana]MBT2794968.1 hypothetical protein [Paraburkholderia strydomiana]